MDRFRRVVLTTVVVACAAALLPASAEAQDPPSIAPVVVMGAGGFSLILGGVFYGLAQSNYDSAVNDPVHESAAGAASSANTFTHLSNALFVIGGSLLLFGIGWTAVEFTRPTRRGVSARLDIGPGTLSLNGTFD